MTLLSGAGAGPASAQGITLDLLGATGGVTSSLQEFEPIGIRARDPGLAGAGSVVVELRSLLRDDREQVELTEIPAQPGTFTGTLPSVATLDPAAAVWNDGSLEITEAAGPPLERDYVWAVLPGCSVAPCPTAGAAIEGNRLRLLDSSWQEIPVGPRSFYLRVEVRDFSVPATAAVPVALTAGADFETLMLQPQGDNRFSATIDVGPGEPLAGDQILEAEAGAVLTASRPDPLGLSAASDSLTVVAEDVYFADRFGDPAFLLAIGGPVRLRAAAPEANLDPNAIDLFTVTVEVQESPSLDRETLDLAETGPATGIFAGELPSVLSDVQATADDGRVEAPASGIVRVTTASGLASDQTGFQPGIARFLDSAGNGVSEVHPGTLYLELESYVADTQPASVGTATATLSSVQGADQVSIQLTEDGPDSPIFRATSFVAVRPVHPTNGMLEATPGDDLVLNFSMLSTGMNAFALLTANSGNQPPVAVGEAVSTDQRQALRLADLLANDSDPEGGALTLLDFSYPANGSLERDPLEPATLIYTPYSYFTGQDSFTYTVFDPPGDTATATVTVTVRDVDLPPVAQPDAISCAEDGSLYFNVRSNDFDPDGTAITLQGYDTTSLRGGQIRPGGGVKDLQYLPAANFFGTDSFTYTITSGGLTATGIVTITVTPVNDAPVAVADSVTTAEEAAVTIAVLTNDGDPDGDAITFYSLNAGSNNVVANADGTVTFTPAVNYNGTRTFTYRIRDTTGAISASATVSVTVTPVDDPPVALNDSFSVAEDVSTPLNVRGNDSDPDGTVPVVQSVGSASHGTVSLVAGAVSYLSQLNYNGPDSFTYTVADGTGLVATATVNLTVTAVNDAPLAVADVAITAEDIALDVDVLANDSDVEGSALGLYRVAAPLHGSVTSVVVGGKPMFRYTPQANYYGTDSFTYQAYDSAPSYSSAVLVSLTITPVNDAPAANNDWATTAEDTAVTIDVLANDTDLEGNALSVVSAVVEGGATGSVAIQPDQRLVYLPGLNYYGSTGYITYQVSDGNATASARVNLTVTAVNNDPPTAVTDQVTVFEDQPISVNVIANDFDPDTGPVTLQWAAAPLHIATLSANTLTGVVTATPQADYNGVASFAYVIKDSSGLTSSGSVIVTILPVNDPPTAVADAATVAEDGAITVAVLQNDSDRDGDAIVVSGVGSAQHGSVSFDGAGISYSPAADYSGPDAVVYTVSDGSGLTATATLSLTVTPVNDAPVAEDDAASVAEDGQVTIAVLANDSDPEGQPLSLDAVGSAAHGVVTIAGSALGYSPAADWNGVDSFTYTLSDGQGGSATARVTVSVGAVNDAPTAVADSAATSEDEAVAIAVLANDSDLDGDALSVGAYGGAAHGSLSLAGGVVTYTPAADYHGGDSFTYEILDGQGGSASATVTVTVAPANDSPVAVGDAATTAEDTPLSFSPLGNDGDPDGDELAIAAVAALSGGAATSTATTITFIPAADWNGTAQIEYTVSDGHGGSATATVAVTITPVNDPPVAFPDAGSLAEDGSLVLPVLQNDLDLETPAGLNVIAAGPAAHGTVAFTVAAVIYTPAANYSGPDAFSYTVADDSGATATATVAIVVDPVNDPPLAGADSATAISGSPLVLNLLANDADLEGAALAVTAVGTPLHGVAVRNADNTVTYTSAAGYTGNDSFTYTLSDGAATATGTVAVLVKSALGRASVLALRSLLIETGADVVSGDVVANVAGGSPYLGATDVELQSGATVAAGWGVKANGVKINAGATVFGSVTSNSLTNLGSVSGGTFSPLGLPVFDNLPTLQTATPGATDVNVATNQTLNLAPGVYRDLLVAKKGTVNFTGGVYVFRSVVIQREANLLFAAPATVKVQQKMSTATLTKIQPGAGSTATPATIVWHIAGINGTNGALASTPKPLEIATDNVIKANFYVPNGTLWLQARTAVTGAVIGKWVRLGPDVQVSLQSAW